ncbi:MAG TPA: Sb-PDE family phosphodiesterase [Candidatus Paceibacterota bacterium]|nr:Sb-PDE family phosphodiesterase [Verrucomicrobiota bacterium]HSA12518.1 Sb-PDE family phosphodiesterase [Candidatus Paceibacterota bacterium]
MVTNLVASLASAATLLLSVLTAVSHEPVARVRTPVRIPNILNFLTLKCDFHTHTVFSDGYVWPTIRVEEAWRNGLDAIAITDHIEYQPYKGDITTNHNRSFEVASPAGKSLDVLVIKGSEITRDMPPGHLNAVFLRDANALAVRNWRDALAAAHSQDAFIFWNHPGWKPQAPGGKAVWYPEHTELLQKGMLHGVEVANGDEYYPEAHRWAVEHNLAMVSNTDIHNPIGLDYPHDGDFRTTTFVFARERTAASIKEALQARRTAVYFQDKIIGTEQYLRPLCEQSLAVLNPRIAGSARERQYVQLQNLSDVNLKLRSAGGQEGLQLPERTVVPAGKIVLMQIRGDAKKKGEIAVPFKVENYLPAPDTPLEIQLKLQVE